VHKKSQRVERVFHLTEKAPRIDRFHQVQSLNSLNRKIHQLERSLAERENEVWTLKQLLLYR
jgi:hypothetical protein